jgi:hypothetical protein
LTLKKAGRKLSAKITEEEQTLMNPENKFLSLTAKNPTSNPSEFRSEVATQVRSGEP